MSTWTYRPLDGGLDKFASVNAAVDLMVKSAQEAPAGDAPFGTPLSSPAAPKERYHVGEDYKPKHGWTAQYYAVDELKERVSLMTSTLAKSEKFRQQFHDFQQRFHTQLSNLKGLLQDIQSEFPGSGLASGASELLRSMPRNVSQLNQWLAAVSKRLGSIQRSMGSVRTFPEQGRTPDVVNNMKDKLTGGPAKPPSTPPASPAAAPAPLPVAASVEAVVKTAGTLLSKSAQIAETGSFMEPAQRRSMLQQLLQGLRMTQNALKRIAPVMQQKRQLHQEIVNSFKGVRNTINTLQQQFSNDTRAYQIGQHYSALMTQMDLNRVDPNVAAQHLGEFIQLVQRVAGGEDVGRVGAPEMPRQQIHTMHDQMGVPQVGDPAAKGAPKKPGLMGRMFGKKPAQPLQPAAASVGKFYKSASGDVWGWKLS